MQIKKIYLPNKNITVHIGDIVRAEEDIDGIIHAKEIGKIVHINEISRNTIQFGIIWEKYHPLCHSCGSNDKWGHGWWIEYPYSRITFLKNDERIHEE